jgi:serine/threonine protein kinase
MICPACQRIFTDPQVRFCVEDGARLVEPAAGCPAPPEVRATKVRATSKLGAVVGGRYAIRGFVGEGGMARVYLAEDTEAGGQVALKILRREQAGNRLSRERFLREIDVAKSLHHPGVGRIFDAGERSDRCPFLVLEFLSGESMGDVLERERGFAEPYALEWVKEAACALDAAHRAGVVHRDVKPDNLFLTVDGRLKVVDFGFAKLKEGAVTATGMTVGTVPYMAPEQILADPVDGRTDVYGLGVTMFHMLAGSLPFHGASDAELVAQHLYAPPPPPSSRRPGLDPRVDRVVLAAMRKRPENRYPSMAALLEDVERLLGQRPGKVSAPPLTVEPDSYEPRNAMSQTAARFLRGFVR